MPAVEDVEQPEEVEESSETTILRDYSEALLIAIIFLNFARIFLFQAFRIPSGSMADHLLVGDHIVVNKFVYAPTGGPLLGGLGGFKEIRRGDIVVFRYPKDRRADFVKRVVGMPGEEIAIRDKKVLINGRELAEPYVRFSDSNTLPYDPAGREPWRSRDQISPLIIPAGCYFVMGDNRDVSHDSRFWGPVKRELIRGKALLVYWSYDGNPSARGSGRAARAKELLDVATHFISKTRWERTFLVIGASEHQHDRAPRGN